MFGTPDRLGVGLRSRAKQQDRAYARQFGSAGPLKDPMWSAMFQAMQEQGVTGLADESVGQKRGMFAPTAPGAHIGLLPHQASASQGASNQINAPRPPARPRPLPQSHDSFMASHGRGAAPAPTRKAPMHGNQISFHGADAAAGRKARELALGGLDGALEEMRQAREPSMLRQQRANIQGHGTIEMPDQFAQRRENENAAELMDPVNPRAQLAAQEFGRGMSRIEANTEPARLAAGSRLGVADINAGADRYGADQNTRRAEIGADADKFDAALDAFIDTFGLPDDVDDARLEEFRTRLRQEHGF